MACVVSDISNEDVASHVQSSSVYACLAIVSSALLPQVEYLSKHEYFGDVSVTKTPIAQTTAVTSTMTTTLLVISK